jgi:hypothetical protein
MKAICQKLRALFVEELKKVGIFTEKEIDALCFIVTVLSVDPRFSLRRTARASQGRFGRKMLARVLQKYMSVQEPLLEALGRQGVNLVGRRFRFFLAVDDQLVKKRGKKIFGSRQWHDHVTHTSGRALCLVEVALVVQGEALFVLPYLVRTSSVPRPASSPGRVPASREQDAKTAAAMVVIRQLVAWLEAEGVHRPKLGVLADAWYANGTFLAFLREMGLLFRVAGKKNYQVEFPDMKRVARRKNGGRGRKPKRFVQSRRVDVHFETVTAGGSFRDPASGKRVAWNTAVVTLKQGGRVRVFRFWREGGKEPQFILTPAAYRTHPDPKTVYREYAWRWRCEEAHRDLKQQFGLKKCRNRAERVVLGFISLVYSWYSLFLLTRQNGQLSPPERLTAPQYQDAVIHTLYVKQGVGWT